MSDLGTPARVIPSQRVTLGDVTPIPRVIWARAGAAVALGDVDPCL